MPIVIKKKVSLDFLGEDYKDAYLVFRIIPIDDLQDLANVKVKEGEAFKVSKERLQRYFIEGEFPDEEGKLQSVSKEELGQFDQETVNKCLNILLGNEIDPKSSQPSTNGSTTEQKLPTS